jgi:uncharacterized protein
MSDVDRVLPELNPDNELFWTSGAQGTLQLLRCAACKHWLHPAGPVCPACLSDELRPEPVSGRATVFSYTVNHQSWVSGLSVPYAIVIVELAEQAGLRLLTNVVGCPLDDVRIGMQVRLVFEAVEDVYLPLVEPVPAGER